MRTVFIDLTQDGHCRHDSIDVGYTGEHNATELVIAVPPSMADESEYLTAVFLSNGKIIRSEKITETQEDGKPYLTGNQVHILLSKRLTQSPTLGLQIEGYKKNKRGTSVLLGKSPFISSLHFHLSPQGEQDAAAGVDPDELSDLMDWWRNREDSSEYDSDEMSELLNWWRNRTDSSEQYSGELSDLLDWWRNRTDQIPGGIQKYESYHHLPRDADDGDMAYVLNDCGIPIAGTVASWVYYEGFNFKDNLDRDVLQPLTEIDLEEMEPTDVKRVGFTFRTDTDEDLCYFIMMYYAPVGSVFIFSQFACDLDTMEYLSSDYRGELSYMYCAGEGDVSPLFPGGFIDSESAYVTEGWYKVKETIVGYSSKDSYPEPIIRYVIEPIEGCDVVGLKTLRNCFVKVINGDYRTYEKEVLPMFTDFFDVYGYEYKQKGLYLVEDDHWESQRNIRMINARDKTWLPKVGEIGQIAIVKNNARLIVPQRDYTYVGSIYDRLYFNPVLESDAWICDCRISGRYEVLNNLSGEYELYDYDSGFDLMASEKNGYVLLSLNPQPNNMTREHYLYARNSGQIDIPADSQLGNSEPCSFWAGEGWNRITTLGNGYEVWRIDPFVNLPSIILTDTDGVFRMAITEYDCMLSDQSYVSKMPFYSSDNAKGVWYFEGGRWRKFDA